MLGRLLPMLLIMLNSGEVFAISLQLPTPITRPAAKKAKAKVAAPAPISTDVDTDLYTPVASLAQGVVPVFIATNDSETKPPKIPKKISLH